MLTYLWVQKATAAWGWGEAWVEPEDGRMDRCRVCALGYNGAAVILGTGASEREAWKEARASLEKRMGKLLDRAQRVQAFLAQAGPLPGHKKQGGTQCTSTNCTNPLARRSRASSRTKR